MWQIKFCLMLFSVSCFFLSSTIVQAQDTLVVRQLQERLQDMGFKPGPIDGQFGPHTREALQRYQASRGLDATGLLDEATRAGLGMPAHTESAQSDKQNDMTASAGSVTTVQLEHGVGQQVQERLQDRNFEPEVIAGKLGPLTSEALKRYQLIQGVKGPKSSMKLAVNFAQRNHELQKQFKSNHASIRNFSNISKSKDLSPSSVKKKASSSDIQYDVNRNSPSISQLIQPMIIILSIAIPIYLFIQIL
jgi:peptidoglycan hydrolase-like protein with peptidoglycan-binding domain